MNKAFFNLFVRNITKYFYYPKETLLKLETSTSPYVLT